MQRTRCRLMVLLAGVSAAGLCACDSLLDVKEPPSSLSKEVVFSTDQTANSSILGIYRSMIAAQAYFSSGGLTSITGLASLAADELSYNGTDQLAEAFGTYNIVPDNARLLTLWTSLYTTIYQCNAALEGLAASTSLSDEMKMRLEGEAHFIRALCYFYLVNSFGPVPLVLGTDYRINRNASRTGEADVYRQITADLLAARDNLPADFDHALGERVRAGSYAASALLARVYLYSGNWPEAEKYASEVIAEEHTFRLLDDPGKVFLKNSPEAIFQLMAVGSTSETWEAFTALAFSATVPPPLEVSGELLAAFEPGDKRRDAWIGAVAVRGTNHHYPYKYKVRSVPVNTPKSEYSIVLRLSEQYLIRAEARLHRQDHAGAVQDIDHVRALHGGLPEITASGHEAIMAALEQERRVEFFHEWGHRWYDLKRWQTIDATLSAVKENWRPTSALWPVPEAELLKNEHLHPQNEGY